MRDTQVTTPVVAAKPTPSVSVRSLVYEDVDQVLTVWSECFPRCGGSAVFRCWIDRYLKRPAEPWIFRVAEPTDQPGRIVGVIYYHRREEMGLVSGHGWRKRQFLQLGSIFVLPTEQRTGVGRAMLDDVARNLCRFRNRIEALVSERETAWHLFFAACGFRAEDVVKQPSTGNGCDAYLFVRRFQNGEPTS